VSFANFLFFLTAGAAGLLAARLIARHDLRIVALVGAAVAGVCIALIGHAESLWQLCLLYILFAIGWALCGIVPGTTIVTRWFHRRRSLALSIASTGLSVGGILLTPVVKNAIEDHGLATVMPWIGLAFALLTVPGALLLSPWPQRIGQLPDGDAALPSGELPPITGVAEHVAIRSRFFLCVTAAYVFVMAAQVGGISHLVKLASERIDKPTAALVISVMAMASVVARLFGGWIVPKVPMTGYATGLALAQGATLLAMGWVEGRTGLIVIAALFGATIGNTLMMQPLMIAEAFGVRDYARIYSRSQFVSTLGVALGPLLLGVVHDAVDGYDFPYTLAALLSVAGAVLLFAGGATETAGERAESQARAAAPAPAASSTAAALD
jgi:MFS family permease